MRPVEGEFDRLDEVVSDALLTPLGEVVDEGDARVRLKVVLPLVLPLLTLLPLGEVKPTEERALLGEEKELIMHTLDKTQNKTKRKERKKERQTK